MPYPGKPVPPVLPQFRGTAGVRQTLAQRRQLIEFVAAGYQAGCSLRDLAAQTGRSQTAIRRALGQAGVPLRGRGAPRLKDEPDNLS